MIELYNQSCDQCSQLVTNNYSTSFSLGIKMFKKEFRDPIYAIYGFVRFADEIVDTFHQYDKRELIEEFRRDTFTAVKRGISLNPILHSFQAVVRTYNIDMSLVDAFLKSMEMDLDKLTFSKQEYDDYIYGSAEVIGLMCLRIFVEGDNEAYNKLEYTAKMLGSAFQKVNFLRDIQSDYQERGRVYFPGVRYAQFNCDQKKTIELEIEEEFKIALEGIKELPRGARLGVYLAFRYYKKLLKRLKKYSATEVLEQRVRVSDFNKFLLLVFSSFKYQLRLI